MVVTLECKHFLPSSKQFTRSGANRTLYAGWQISQVMVVIGRIDLVFCDMMDAVQISYKRYKWSDEITEIVILHIMG